MYGCPHAGAAVEGEAKVDVGNVLLEALHVLSVTVMVGVMTSGAGSKQVTCS